MIGIAILSLIIRILRMVIARCSPARGLGTWLSRFIILILVRTPPFCSLFDLVLVDRRARGKGKLRTMLILGTRSSGEVEVGCCYDQYSDPSVDAEISIV